MNRIHSMLTVPLRRSLTAMGPVFWLRRFGLVALGIFLLLAAVYLLRGRGAETALPEAGFWALLSALIFTAGRMLQAGRGRECALCRDTPQSQDR
jgi:hypothetical protein